MKRQAKDSHTKVSSFSIPKVADSMLADLSKMAGVTKSLFLTILLGNLLPLPNRELVKKVLFKKGEENKKTLVSMLRALADAYGFQLKESKERYDDKTWSFIFYDVVSGNNFEVVLDSADFTLKRARVLDSKGEEIALIENKKITAKNVPLDIIGFITKLFF